MCSSRRGSPSTNCCRYNRVRQRSSRCVKISARSRADAVKSWKPSSVFSAMCAVRHPSSSIVALITLGPAELANHHVGRDVVGDDRSSTTPDRRAWARARARGTATRRCRTPDRPGRAARADRDRSRRTRLRAANVTRMPALIELCVGLHLVGGDRDDLARVEVARVEAPGSGPPFEQPSDPRVRVDEREDGTWLPRLPRRALQPIATGTPTSSRRCRSATS